MGCELRGAWWGQRRRGLQLGAGSWGAPESHKDSLPELLPHAARRKKQVVTRKASGSNVDYASWKAH